MVQESHSCTWFSVQGLGTITQTEKGSKPGDPLGDLIFHFLVLVILEAAESELKERCLVNPIVVEGVSVCPALQAPRVLMPIDNSYLDDC
eukprot:15435234-Alexandrium_andersonii.AAC.1